MSSDLDIDDRELPATGSHGSEVLNPAYGIRPLHRRSRRIAAHPQAGDVLLERILDSLGRDGRFVIPISSP